MKAFIFLALAFVVSAPAYAAEEHVDYNSSVMVYKETDGLDALVDIPLRISGFVQTVVGTGVFMGISPITAFMNMFPPHDSFDKTAEYLILQPARYTFERPVGDYDFDSRSKHKPHL